MKISNLWKAWLSTVLSIGIGIFSGLTTTYFTGAFDKKTFIAFAAPIVIGGLTDFMKETKQMIDGQEPSK